MSRTSASTSREQLTERFDRLSSELNDELVDREAEIHGAIVALAASVESGARSLIG